MLPDDRQSALPPPLIIPRPAHRVSRKDIDREALKVLYRLHHAGYIAYLVGGSVRDLQLGKKPKDFDIVTNARPGEIRKLFRNSRVIGRRFRLVQVFFRGGNIVEVSTFRRRSEFDAPGEAPSEGQPARDNTFGTPAEDAQRRDLTINGLFYNIGDFSLVDYVGGLEDLQRGYIRVIGDPAVRFSRDPVRMLRVLRHAARTGFAIDPRAREEILAQGNLIRVCPPSRVRDELLKDIHSGAAAPFFQLLLESRLFFAIFPAWTRLLGASGAERLVELFQRVDAVLQAERQLTESLLWAVFLTPYLERQKLPAGGIKELREFILAKGREAFGGIEFPKQRQEEVSLILALEEMLAQHRRQGRPVPARLTRLVAYPEAMLLSRLKEVPAAQLLEAWPEDELPTPAPRAPRRRRHRRRRPRGAPRRPPGP